MAYVNSDPGLDSFTARIDRVVLGAAKGGSTFLPLATTPDGSLHVDTEIVLNAGSVIIEAITVRDGSIHLSAGTASIGSIYATDGSVSLKSSTNFIGSVHAAEVGVWNINAGSLDRLVQGSVQLEAGTANVGSVYVQDGSIFLKSSPSVIGSVHAIEVGTWNVNVGSVNSLVAGSVQLQPGLSMAGSVYSIQGAQVWNTNVGSIVDGSIHLSTSPNTIGSVGQIGVWNVNVGSIVSVGSVMGDVAHDGVDSGNPIKVGGKATSSRPTAVAENDRVNAFFDLNGRQHVIDDSASIQPNYWSPLDGSTTFNHGSVLNCVGWPFTVDDANCYVSTIKYKNAIGSVLSMRNSSGASIVGSNGSIFVYGLGTPFTNTDTSVVVGIRYQDKSYESSGNDIRVSEINPVSLQIAEESLIDTTNIAATSGSYFPSSLGMVMLGYKDFALTGKIIDADGSYTLTTEITADEDATNADWIQVYGYDPKNNATVNSITGSSATKTFAWDFDELNTRFVRVKLAIETATNTVILKARRKA